MALFFTLLCGTAVIILGYLSYYFYQDRFIYDTEAIIDTEIRHAARYSKKDQIELSFRNSERIYLLLSQDNQKLSGNIEALPNEVSLLAEGTIVFNLAKRKYAAKIHTFSDKRKLMVGVDITEVSRDYSVMQWLSILSIIFMFLVIVTSYLISQFVVKNTNRIAATAKDIINTGDLSRRIELKSNWDDLSYMASVLNELLDRIQVLMQGIREVSDNIAHDLRTPLTRLKNKLEDLQVVAKNKDTKRINKELIEETDNILNTFNALLRISRIETGKQHSAFSNNNLADLLEDALELYEPLAEDKKITITKEIATVKYNCDRDLLFQAFANLIDNAIKYTPSKGEVKIGLEQKTDKIEIYFSDTGVGINENDKDKVFDRFYRAESSRNTSGSGLGLSLVKAVIKLHNGNIYIKNNEPGLRVKITL
jgi:signal transduction histidine kinase